MSNLIIVGAQLGDECKAACVDRLAQEYDIVVRFQGGPNAGHTIYHNNQKVVLHQIPSGILYPNVECLIGQGCVLDIEVLKKELDQLEQLNIPNVRDRLFISDKVQLITQEDVLADVVREVGSNPIGTTKKGIGPAYAKKALRSGSRSEFLSDIFNVIDGTQFLKQAIEDDKKILYEGAQGIMLDIDFGAAPYTTSSHTVPQYAGIGSGYPLTRDTKIYGITKAYTTYVGEGPFVVDFKENNLEELDEAIRTIGNEYGSTTGRPRRIGALDLVALKYACDIGNIDKLILTKIDVLSNLPLYVCSQYKSNQINISSTKNPSFNLTKLKTYKPLLAQLTGWTEDLTQMTKYEQMPLGVLELVSVIEEYTGSKIAYISVGPNRNQMIKVE